MDSGRPAHSYRSWVIPFLLNTSLPKRRGLNGFQVLRALTYPRNVIPRYPIVWAVIFSGRPAGPIAGPAEADATLGSSQVEPEGMLRRGMRRRHSISSSVASSVRRDAQAVIAAISPAWTARMR